MDDFIGEVSCTELMGIEPGEQALTLRFLILVVWCVRTLNIKKCVLPLRSVVVHLCRVAPTLQVDSSGVSLLTPPCNR